MIFFLNVTNQELEALPENEMLEFLSEVGRASRRGHHLFVLTRSLAKFIAGLDSLGDYYRAEYKRLWEDATQNFSLLSEADRYVQIEIGNNLQDLPGERKWIVGHKRAINSELLEKPRFILEDAHSDGGVYEDLLSTGTAVGRGFKIQFEARHGGGNQTFRRLKDDISSGAVSVCICDHDMRAPGGAKSETYNKARNEARKTDFIGGFFSPPYRELENLFPLQVIRKHYPQVDSDSLDQLDALITRQGEVAPGDCLWLFFDVKEGASGEKLEAKFPNGPGRIWLETKYLNDAVLQLKDVSFPGFGDNVVSTVRRNAAGRSDMQSFVKSDYWKFHFQAFFEHIAWLFVGEKRARL